MKSKAKLAETIRFRVTVTERDIREGECGLANRCMEKVAIERSLRDMDPKSGDHRTRVDAGHIRFNFFGYKFEADTPKIAKSSLIQFDKEEKARGRAERDGIEFISKVRPHSYMVEATRLYKLKKISPERQEEITRARQARAAAGFKPKRYTLHKRVVGFA